jgi:predicted phosphodiesterase
LSSFRFLHLADLHLDSPLRGLEADPDAPAERIRMASRLALHNAVDFALRERLELVVIAGDLFDGDWQDWRTGHFLVGQIGRLTRAGIRVVAIRGNHDAASVLTRHIAWGDGARLLSPRKPETVELPEIGVAIHGQSFRDRETLENLARDYPPPRPGRFNIGLLHTAATGRDGHDNYAPCTVEQLVAHGYDYWALGHVHAREELHPDPWIVFPGNLQGRHINEEGAKGGTLVTVRDGRASVAHVPFDVVRWRRLEVDLAGSADLESAFALVRRGLMRVAGEADGRLLALRVELIGASPAHAALAGDLGETCQRVRSELLAVAGADQVWLESVRVATGPALDRMAMRAQAGAPGDLVRAIEAADAATLGAALRSYAGAMLEKASGLREALGARHPAVRLAAGEMPEDLLERARDLLLGRLAEH